MRCVVLFVILTMGCATSNDRGERPEPRRCEELRDHLVDLRLWEATGVDRAAHRDAMRDALGPAFVTGCTSAMTEIQVECALKAADVAAATVCTTAR
jgi:hypothetical protein